MRRLDFTNLRARLLAEHPEITRTSVHAAAAAADTVSLEALLREDPALADSDGSRWGYCGVGRRW